MRYCPAGVSWWWMQGRCFRSVAVTMALGTTAPVASNTVPVSSPEVVCAKLERLRAVNTTAPTTIRAINFGSRVLFIS